MCITKPIAAGSMRRDGKRVTDRGRLNAAICRSVSLEDRGVGGTGNDHQCCRIVRSMKSIGASDAVGIP